MPCPLRQRLVSPRSVSGSPGLRACALSTRALLERALLNRVLNKSSLPEPVHFRVTALFAMLKPQPML
jgi:hypothetical protein